MKINRIYVQHHSDVDIYLKPLRRLKNGSLAGLMFQDWGTGRFGGAAVNTSFRGISPVPALAEDVPAPILEKFAQAEEGKKGL